MEVLENEVLEGKSIVLDGKYFNNCRYTKCTLLYEGGEWASISTTFDQCPIMFNGAAARTMNLMASFGMLKQNPVPMQAPPSMQPPSGSLQ